MNQVTMWLSFNALILVLLAIDLGVFHRSSKAITIREALLWTGIWVFIAFLFNVFVYYQFGEQKAFEFFTGYLIEKSLSVDNIFVMVMIFSYFQVPVQYQHKVLFWGILGALIMRFGFIYSGIELIHKFNWLIYIFGGFLVFTGIKLIRQSEENFDPEQNPVVKIARKCLPITPSYSGDQFFVRKETKLWATPLFLVVLLIEATDLIFAVDSIPAILAITDDAFIVYTSNTFAILGLRSLYFALAGVEKYFSYLKYGLAVILIFIGTKMCIADIYKIPIEISLAFIVLTLSVSVLMSMILNQERVSKEEGKPLS